MTDSTAYHSKLFKEDISIATGGTGAEETGTRLTSAGGVLTLTKLDLAHIPYRNYSGTPEDLIDGGYDLDIKPRDCLAGRNITAGGTLQVTGATTLTALTPAGYVKNSVAGLLSTGSIAAADLPTAIDVAKLADGSISNAEFQYLNGAASNIQTQINTIIAGAAVQASFAVLQNRQAQNTGGGTATQGSWGIVPLNVEHEDADSIVDSTALPAFSLAAGTYRIEATCPFHLCGNAQIRLYNVTDAAAQQNVGSADMLGSVTMSYSGGATTVNDSFLVGTFTIAGTKQLRLEYRVITTSATNGLGLPANFGVEVYAQVSITKIA